MCSYTSGTEPTLTCGMLTELLRHTWKSLTRTRAQGALPPPVSSANGTEEAGLLARLQSFPEDADAWHRLGELANGTGSPETALTHHEMALRLAPDHFWAGLAAAGLAHQMGRHEYALTLYRHALTVPSGHAHAAAILTNMGVILKDLVRLPEAIATYRQSLDADPDIAETHYNLGLALYETGLVDEAEQHLRRAIEIRPGFTTAHSSLLCIYGFSRNQDAKRLLEEHQRWGSIHADPLTPEHPRFDNTLDTSRRLTVGYVSADLCEHSMRFFMEPILANHDRNSFRIVCYDNWPGDDAVNQRLRTYTDGWRKVNRMNDEELAGQIRADRVDILVDLSGHTTGNRLLAFARKPAPVQVSWLGYMCTTGMRAMDYRITDPHLDPPGQTERFYTEELMRMPTAATFSPAPESPPVNSLPALARGYITFASFNNYTKVGDAVVACWVRLLQDLPSSRLMIVMLGGDDATIQAEARTRFASHCNGDADSVLRRIEIRGRRALPQFLRMFHEADVALDPYPHCGGTTSLHTLWMGLPIITIEGDSELSRSTGGMMRSCGLDHLVAQNQESYLNVAKRLAADLPGLADIRAGLRGRVAASSIGDSTFVTRNLESVYHAMWSNFVARQRALAA